MIGVATYVVGLVATLPARLIVAHGPGTNIPDVAGTILHGEAALAGGELLDWRWAPLRSLVELGFAVDWTATSDRTSLAGRARFRPGVTSIADMSGTADGALLKSALPGLPFTCDMPLQIDLKRVTIGGADQRVEGRVLSDAGGCAPKGAANLVAPVPALLFEATPDGPNSRGRIVRQALRRVPLATLRLTRDGRLSVAVTRDGARALPFASPPGGLTIDTTL